MGRGSLLMLLTLTLLFVDVRAQTTAAEGQKYALIIGIANYPGFPADQQLKYADQDAIQFKSFIESSEGGSFPAENIRLLTNAKARRDDIEREISWLSKRAHRDDTIYVFFSGHGMEDANGIVYFMPYGSDHREPSVGTLRANYFLKDLSEKITSQNLLVFIDACHAAAATTPNGTAKGGPANVNAALKKGWEEAFKGVEESNMAFFSASANQRSWEDADKQQGVFTWFLLQGLKGAADKDQDKVVTAGELQLYLLDKVGAYTSKKFGREQTPLPSPKFNAKFPLAVFSVGDWFERGVAAYQRNAYAEAVELLTQAIQRNGQYSFSYLFRGLAKSALGDKQGAIVDYTQGLALDPKNALAYVGRGIAKDALGDKQGAIVDFTQAIELDPKNSWAFWWRGGIKSDLGDQQGKIADFQQAARLGDKDAQEWLKKQGLTW